MDPVRVESVFIGNYFSIFFFKAPLEQFKRRFIHAIHQRVVCAKMHDIVVMDFFFPYA